MEAIRNRSYFVNQIFVVSGVLSMILSCGLGLGFISAFHQIADDDKEQKIDDRSLRFIETAGEIAFVPSILIIPYTMQNKGRRIASLATTLPLLLTWIISYEGHYTSLLIFNVLHNVALGGAITISCVIISEYCAPKYRGMFLILETAMISLGVLLSHVSGMLLNCGIICTLGMLTATYSLVVIYFAPESPYWLINEGHIVKCTESFHWLRGRGDDAFRELEAMLQSQKIKMQLDALRPISRMNMKERAVRFLKSLLKMDFLKPLSIMLLLFSFLGLGGESIITNYSLRDIFKLANGKYIGTIILDALSLICALTACVLIQIVKRKTLFLFTGSFSILFLALASLLLFLQSIELFSNDYIWLCLSLITGFVMFMSLGTTSLPFSLLGEIFPMAYKGIGNSLICAYLWAFGNSIMKLVPSLVDAIGLHGVLFLTVVVMMIILVLFSKIMPETNAKTLLEIEQLMKNHRNIGSSNYEVVNVVEQDDVDNFDKLKLFIDV